jgi:MoxR-like ATPase
VALNQSLAQSHFFSELRVQAGLNGFIKRHENTRIMAACNTFGKGGSIIYSGRNQLDAATTDRFYMVYMDYDETLEKQIGSFEVVDWVHKLRKRVRELEIHEVVSTRMIIRMDAAINCGARTFREAKADALLSWSLDHRIQVGEA